MKKLLLFIIVALLPLFHRRKVKPQPANGQMIFYAKSNTDIWGLIFEGVEVGNLKYAAQSPPCGAVGHITIAKTIKY